MNIDANDRQLKSVEQSEAIQGPWFTGLLRRFAPRNDGVSA